MVAAGAADDGDDEVDWLTLKSTYASPYFPSWLHPVALFFGVIPLVFWLEAVYSVRIYDHEIVIKLS